MPALTPVDIGSLVRAFLLAQSSIVAEVGARVFVAVEPPTGYRPVAETGKPLTGKGVVILPRNPQRISQGTLVNGQVYLRCYAATEAEAWDLDALITPLLDGATLAGVNGFWQSLPGQLSRTSEGWPYVFATYDFIAH